MVWKILISSMFIAQYAVMASDDLPTSTGIPTEMRACQSKCGVPLEIRMKPTKPGCKKWNECDDNEKQCASGPKLQIIYTNNVCNQFVNICENREYANWNMQKCGIPHVVSKNPTPEACEKWNKCSGKQKECAAHGRDDYLYADKACSKYPTSG
ncbi:uncharacterized protein CELE_F09C6.10 [Caenorhabditis elegans]|uniref:Secreted protein n=1 Tax=Caenorhabditis elegans TaxID=6239 RepID=Q9XV99_CAEEL|nr:Secreted protein [Caenorhabditis elegans]CAB04065.1 Secreted protein [Caenorhabditis elegans]|eukprot:NP_507274.1 Uncharacterized protein CELE_F09C6.10 [Caenorhabditis elegans]